MGFIIDYRGMDADLCRRYVDDEEGAYNDFTRVYDAIVHEPIRTTTVVNSKNLTSMLTMEGFT